MAEYMQLKRTLTSMKLYRDSNPKNTSTHQDNSIKTMMDLGQNFYCQAVIRDSTRLFVLVGYGYYVEMTREEAIPFIDSKVERLKIKSELLIKDSAKIKAHIKLVMEGLKELQQLKYTENQEHCNFY